MMHSTTTDRETVKVYLQCVLCVERGIITECYKDSLNFIGPSDTSSSVMVAPIICYCCGDERKKEYEAKYYRENGVPLQYIRRTIIAHDAHIECSGGVYIDVDEDIAMVADINVFTKVMSPTSQMYSLEFDDGRLFEEEPEFSFFGVDGLLT